MIPGKVTPTKDIQVNCCRVIRMGTTFMLEFVKDCTVGEFEQVAKYKSHKGDSYMFFGNGGNINLRKGWKEI